MRGRVRGRQLEAQVQSLPRDVQVQPSEFIPGRPSESLSAYGPHPVLRRYRTDAAEPDRTGGTAEPDRTGRKGTAGHPARTGPNRTETDRAETDEFTPGLHGCLHGCLHQANVDTEGGGATGFTRSHV